MSNVEALKKLFVAMGGDPDDFNVNTNPEAIDMIASIASTALAPELPAVTAEDDGKILKVVDGAWAVASA